MLQCLLGTNIFIEQLKKLEPENRLPEDSLAGLLLQLDGVKDEKDISSILHNIKEKVISFDPDFADLSPLMFMSFLQWCWTY